MKHRVAGRKLGRTSSHRLALLRNLSTSLFDKERITTTLMKAKELRPFAEKLVTLAKKETLHARRRVLRHVRDREVVSKLFDTLSARYAQRAGGYTRIVKLGPRRGDGAEMALIELVDAEIATKKKAADADKGKGAKAPAKETSKEAKRAKEKAADKKPAKAAKSDAAEKATRSKKAAAPKKASSSKAGDAEAKPKRARKKKDTGEGPGGE